MLAGCGGGTPTAPTSETASSTSTTTSVVAAPPSSRPASPLSPDGFGANPPTRAQLRELGQWLDGPGKGVKAATDDASEGIDAMNAAKDISALKIACQNITDPLTLRLPAGLPSPDPDTTNAFQYLVDDGTALSIACSSLTDPPTDAQLTAVEDAMHQLGTDLTTAGTIMNRNGDLLRAEAGR